MTRLIKDIIIVLTMASYRTIRTVQTIVAITIIVLAIAVIAYVGRIIFFPNDTNTTSKVDTSETALLSTTADRAVRMTVRGPIVADEDFRSYQIQITPNERVLTTYKGYLAQPISSIPLGNNIPAYEQLVYALNAAGMMNADEFTGDSNDTRGVCATGRLYEFQILNAGKSIKRLWTTSCSNSRGSLNISVDPLVDLLTKQIPTSQTVIGRLWR